MRTPFALIIACFAFIFLFSFSSFAQQASTGKLERRIADLEKRVENLETQLSELQSQVQQLTTRNKESSSYDQPAKQPAKGKQNWRRLSVGMSMSEVKTIFGEPDKLDGGTYSTTWWYKGEGFSSGFIIFDRNGRIQSWSEPD